MEPPPRPATGRFRLRVQIFDREDAHNLEAKPVWKFTIAKSDTLALPDLTLQSLYTEVVNRYRWNYPGEEPPFKVDQIERSQDAYGSDLYPKDQVRDIFEDNEVFRVIRRTPCYKNAQLHRERSVSIQRDIYAGTKKRGPPEHDHYGRAGKRQRVSGIEAEHPVRSVEQETMEPEVYIAVDNVAHPAEKIKYPLTVDNQFRGPTIDGFDQGTQHDARTDLMESARPQSGSSSGGRMLSPVLTSISKRKGYFDEHSDGPNGVRSVSTAMTTPPPLMHESNTPGSMDDTKKLKRVKKGARRSKPEGYTMSRTPPGVDKYEIIETDNEGSKIEPTARTTPSKAEKKKAQASSLQKRVKLQSSNTLIDGPDQYMPATTPQPWTEDLERKRGKRAEQQRLQEKQQDLQDLEEQQRLKKRRLEHQRLEEQRLNAERLEAERLEVEREHLANAAKEKAEQESRRLAAAQAERTRIALETEKRERSEKREDERLARERKTLETAEKRKQQKLEAKRKDKEEEAPIRGAAAASEDAESRETINTKKTAEEEAKQDSMRQQRAQEKAQALQKRDNVENWKQPALERESQEKNQKPQESQKLLKNPYPLRPGKLLKAFAPRDSDSSAEIIPEMSTSIPVSTVALTTRGKMRVSSTPQGRMSGLIPTALVPPGRGNRISREQSSPSIGIDAQMPTPMQLKGRTPAVEPPASLGLQNRNSSRPIKETPILPPSRRGLANVKNISTGPVEEVVNTPSARDVIARGSSFSASTNGIIKVARTPEKRMEPMIIISSSEEEEGESDDHSNSTRRSRAIRNTTTRVKLEHSSDGLQAIESSQLEITPKTAIAKSNTSRSISEADSPKASVEPSSPLTKLSLPALKVDSSGYNTGKDHEAELGRALKSESYNTGEDSQGESDHETGASSTDDDIEEKPKDLQTQLNGQLLTDSIARPSSPLTRRDGKMKLPKWDTVTEQAKSLKPSLRRMKEEAQLIRAANDAVKARSLTNEHQQKETLSLVQSESSSEETSSSDEEESDKSDQEQAKKKTEKVSFRKIGEQFRVQKTSKASVWRR